MTEHNPNYPKGFRVRLDRVARALRHLARAAVSAGALRVADILRAHRRCMRDNRNYRQAVLTGMTALVAAMTLDPAVAALLTAAVAIYVAVFQKGDEGPFHAWRPDDPYRSW